MIPTIEDILDDLFDQRITLDQAKKWINEHLSLAEERGYEQGHVNGYDDCYESMKEGA
jgi:hypothetical protein